MTHLSVIIYIWIPHHIDLEAGILYLIKKCCLYSGVHSEVLGDLALHEVKKGFLAGG